MNALLVGYARCSTDTQDVTAQRDGLVALGATTDRIYVDHGLTGTNRTVWVPRTLSAQFRRPSGNAWTSPQASVIS